MTHNKYAQSEGFISDKDRRKRLGQYYSGPAVAQMLAALSLPRASSKVLDPMAGRGDLLAAVSDLNAGIQQLHAIEIDPAARKQCDERLGLLQLPSYASFGGSAFDPNVTRKLSSDGYDLVITNPPYVRYQSLKESAGRHIHLPNALEVRNGLRECIKSVGALDSIDKELFDVLVTAYSGFSDLAVPSWILCAALVRPNGRLAMVVPDAWLNRDYSAVVQYMLMRWFRIEFIVEDEHAVWFPDAQVKTTLLVAQRIPRRRTISDWNKDSYLHISIPASLSNEECLVGRSLLHTMERPDLSFARRARRVLSRSSNDLDVGVSWRRISLADRSRAVVAMAAQSLWLKVLEPKIFLNNVPRATIPPALAKWFRGYENLATLEELGVFASQGLRTGANEFFYSEVVSSFKGGVQLQLSKLFAHERVRVPDSCVLPVVRKQRDLSGRLLVESSALNGRVFALQKYSASPGRSSKDTKAMPSVLAKVVRRAARKRMPSGVLIPKLTAVAPNARRGNIAAGTSGRSWYMLPEFSSRHRPDLFVARVNSGRPLVFLNKHRSALVDANFSTLWLGANAKISVYAVCAFLNSSVAVALYEFAGSVMGGGALKLESTHLRALPIPELSVAVWGRLDSLGRSLVLSSHSKRCEILRSIDKEICTCMFGAKNATRKLALLLSFIEQRQSARKRKARSKGY